jgi:hypothetical protein
MQSGMRHQCTALHNIKQRYSTGDDRLPLLVARGTALIEAHQLARGVAELAAWLQARCPQLWAAAGEQLRLDWPGDVHPVTAAVVRYWLALELVGAMRPDVRLALCGPLRALETARQAYHAGEPSAAYRVWLSRIDVIRSALATDGQERRSSGIRARRAHFLAVCGVKRGGEPRKPGRSGPGDPRSPG